MKHQAEMAAILKQVELLTPEEQAHLSVMIRERARRSWRPAKPSIDELVGAGRGNGPAPSDEDVVRWIRDYRTEKYGR